MQKARVAFNLSALSLAALCIYRPSAALRLNTTTFFSNFFPEYAVNVTYDYVVVGGGTAGLAVAHRLAESGLYTVAVIEAGGFYEIENGNTSVVPGLAPVYDSVTRQSVNVAPLVDWGFLTTPQAPLNNRTTHYSRGKTLGGRYVCVRLLKSGI